MLPHGSDPALLAICHTIMLTVQHHRTPKHVISYSAHAAHCLSSSESCQAAATEHVPESLTTHLWLQNYTATWLRNLATNEQPTFVTPLSCTTPASGISVVASSPTGAPAAAPALSATSMGTLTSVVDGNTTTLVSCPASAARNVPTICPFVKACGETSSVTLTNGTVGFCYMLHRSHVEFVHLMA